tara:strand:+ start:107 stop:406 length:300 start_codon:yes stop_codon:yes gene_type:complete
MATKKEIDVLIEQNIMLSKKTAETIKQMKILTSRVDKLVGIFEKASKQVGDVQTSDEMIRSLSERLSDLLEQNKTIASGLLALEKYVRQRTEEPRNGPF